MGRALGGGRGLLETGVRFLPMQGESLLGTEDAAALGADRLYLIVLHVWHRKGGEGRARLRTFRIAVAGPYDAPGTERAIARLRTPHAAMMIRM